MIIKTVTAGDYTANIFANAMVDVFEKNTLIDNPGPWDTVDGAIDWATLIVLEFAENGRPS